MYKFYEDDINLLLLESIINRHDFNTVVIYRTNSIESWLTLCETKILEREPEYLMRSRLEGLDFELGYRFPKVKHYIKGERININDSRRLPFVGSELFVKGLILELMFKVNNTSLFENDVEVLEPLKYFFTTLLRNSYIENDERLSSYGITGYKDFADFVLSGVNPLLLKDRVIIPDIEKEGLILSVSEDTILDLYLRGC